MTNITDEETGKHFEMSKPVAAPLCLPIIRPIKKMFVCRSCDRPKIFENLGCFFFFEIQFGIFKQKFQNKSFKMHCNCPKSLRCRHRRYVYSIDVSPRLFDVTYLNTENYI